MVSQSLVYHCEEFVFYFIVSGELLKNVKWIRNGWERYWKRGITKLTSFLKGNFDDNTEEEGLEKVPESSGSQTGSSSVTWKLVRNADSQALTPVPLIESETVLFASVACQNLKLGIWRPLRLHEGLQMLFKTLSMYLISLRHSLCLCFTFPM